MAFDRRETALLLAGDFLILAASLWLALALRTLSLPSYPYFEVNLIPFLPLFFLSLLIFYIAGLYEKQTRPIRRVMTARIAGAQAATVGISAILFFVLPLTIAPKTILLLYLVISVMGVTAWRLYRMNREIALGVRVPAILVGSGRAAQELFDEVNNNGRYLIRFAARIETAGQSADAVAQAVIESAASGAHMIVLNAREVSMEALSGVYGRRSSDAVLYPFAALYEEIFDRVPLSELDPRELLESAARAHLLYDAMKRTFDILLATLLSIIALPIIFLAALLLALESGNPFIYPERIGRGGRIIRLVKLRTMLFFDAGDPELHKKNRVTIFGRFLRKSRIDELPQLWNVLRGDISFIGPRPEFPTIAEVYEKEIPLYPLRHLIAPGLSGWAQIHDYDAPRGGADVLRTERKLSYDLYYLKHRSFGLDLAIAAKTLRALSSFSGT